MTQCVSGATEGGQEPGGTGEQFLLEDRQEDGEKGQRQLPPSGATHDAMMSNVQIHTQS